MYLEIREPPVLGLDWMDCCWSFSVRPSDASLLLRIPPGAAPMARAFRCRRALIPGLHTPTLSVKKFTNQRQTPTPNTPNSPRLPSRPSRRLPQWPPSAASPRRHSRAPSSPGPPHDEPTTATITPRRRAASTTQRMPSSAPRTGTFPTWASRRQR